MAAGIVKPTLSPLAAFVIRNDMQGCDPLRPTPEAETIRLAGRMECPIMKPKGGWQSAYITPVNLPL
jgi:hypothetical protein